MPSFLNEAKQEEQKGEGMEEKETIVNICGYEYTIKEVKEEDDKMIINNYGYVDVKTREIKISNKVAVGEINETVRHEMIHAYFRECGLSEYCHDEVLVENISIMLPKWVEEMSRIGVMGNER